MKKPKTYYTIEKRIRDDKEWFDKRTYEDFHVSREQYKKFIKETESDKLPWNVEYKFCKVIETTLFNDKIKKEKLK